MTLRTASAERGRSLPVAELRRRAAAEQAHLETLYRDLHRHPELSGQERATAARMAREMTAAGFEVTEGVGGGVVGVLRNGDGPVVLVRGDMDGLPISEATGAPYASENEGVMHACGHDAHMTVMIGAGRVAEALRSRWSGTLLLVAQPAEEQGDGAAAMIADGLYTRFPRPEVALGVHSDAGLAAGQIGWASGPYNANITSVDITVRGVGGHGAYPHTTVDPVVLASRLILSLQTIVSREVDPTEPAVVTVGAIHGGTKANIIPEEVALKLTVRTHQEEVRRQVVRSIERISDGVARATGVPEDRRPEVTINGVLPAVLNDPAVVRRATGAMRQVLGEERVVPRAPTMGGDDFAIYGAQQPRVPSFMFRLGTVAADQMAAAEADGAALPGLHSPQFLPDPAPMIESGVLAMSAAVIELMGR